MKGAHRVLIAAQPAAWRLLQTMLAGLVDLVPAHTSAEAFKILAHDRIDLIVCTIAFDESQMTDFLETVKRTVPASTVPFLCARVLKSVLRDSMVASMREACIELGAVDLIDVANLPSDRAQTVVRAAVSSSLRPAK